MKERVHWPSTPARKDIPNFNTAFVKRMLKFEFPRKSPSSLWVMHCSANPKLNTMKTSTHPSRINEVIERLLAVEVVIEVALELVAELSKDP